MVLSRVQVASRTLTIVLDGLRCLVPLHSKRLRLMMLDTRAIRHNVRGMVILVWRHSRRPGSAFRRGRGRDTFTNRPLANKIMLLWHSKNCDIVNNPSHVTDRSCLRVTAKGNFDIRGNLDFKGLLQKLLVEMKDPQVLHLGPFRIIQSLSVRNFRHPGLYRVDLHHMHNRNPLPPMKRRP